MKAARIAAQSRARLDVRLSRFGPAEQYRVPSRGWIKAIRQGLGMSTAQLARRMGIQQPSVVNIESSEEKNRIALSTLKRAAEALDCTVAYVLIPNKPLETIVRERARAFVRRRRKPVEHTMLLEDQHVGEPLSERQLDDIVRETNPRLFWE